MARRRRTKVKLPQIEMNLTPLMDVTFQLMIFFILVTNFLAADDTSINLPKPQDSVAHFPDERRRMTLNLVPAMQLPGQAGSPLYLDYVEVATEIFKPVGRNPDFADLADFLTRKRDEYNQQQPKGPPMEVTLRADRALRSDQTYPVEAAVQKAGFTRVNWATAEELPPAGGGNQNGAPAGAKEPAAP